MKKVAMAKRGLSITGSAAEILSRYSIFEEHESFH